MFKFVANIDALLFAYVVDGPRAIPIAAAAASYFAALLLSQLFLYNCVGPFWLYLVLLFTSIAGFLCILSLDDTISATTATAATVDWWTVLSFVYGSWFAWTPFVFTILLFLWWIAVEHVAAAKQRKQDSSNSNNNNNNSRIVWNRLIDFGLGVAGWFTATLLLVFNDDDNGTRSISWFLPQFTTTTCPAFYSS